jgi:uncharacterized protein (TIGR03435 family)
VYGGPSWLEMDRFDVFAKTPGASNAQSRALMLQALLADRFHLVVHKDNKPMATFALAVAKKPLLKEAEGSGDTGCKFDFQNTQQRPPSPDGGPVGDRAPRVRLHVPQHYHGGFRRRTDRGPRRGPVFRQPPGSRSDRVAGRLGFHPEVHAESAGRSHRHGRKHAAIRCRGEATGLKTGSLHRFHARYRGGHVNEKPTPNPPDIAKTFPSPTEFEVAELRPSDPAASGGRGGEQRPEIKNGRVYVPGITLKNLVMLAWDLDSDEMLPGAPKWMDEDHFDLIAKAPPGVALGDLTPQRSSVSANIEALRPMLRSLIVDRFKLTTHTEQRPINTYTLTAVKPKLTKADPSSRTKWEEGVDPRSKNNKERQSLDLPAGDLPQHDHGSVCAITSRHRAGLPAHQGGGRDESGWRLGLHVQLQSRGRDADGRRAAERAADRRRPRPPKPRSRAADYRSSKRW